MANNTTDEVFYNLTPEDVRQNTFGQTLQHGTMEIFEYYVPKANVLADALNEETEKIRIKAFIAHLIENTTENQVKDLLKGLHETTETYAVKETKAYQDVLEDELWVHENFRDALEDLTIDGTEGEKDQKIDKKAIWDFILVKGGDSGNEADKSD